MLTQSDLGADKTSLT